MSNEYDLIVIGCGPGGAAAAIHAAEAGLRVAAIEKEEFPRYHIGESLTGSAGEMLRGLGLEDELNAQKYPLKSGVKVMGQTGNEYFVPVLASTWQVRRDSFDRILMDRAKRAGAEVIRGRVLRVQQEDDSASRVIYTTGADEVSELRAAALIDASGSACVLSRLGIAGERTYDDFGDQIAVFSQVEGAERDPGEMGDNTFIFHAAAHHWAWFIPLSPSLVSVGIVVPQATFKELGKDPAAVFQWGLENINPDLARRTAGRPLTEPVRACKDYSYRVEPFAGPGWMCIGDAHRFADPIFSFGVTASMQEARVAVDGVVEALRGGSWTEVVRRYTDYSDYGQEAIFDFIKYFWKYPGFFGVQMRGRFRKDVVRLFGGDIFVPNQVVDQIRGYMQAPAGQAAAEMR